MAASGWKTLLIDMDPQGNASTGLGIENSAREFTSYDLLLGDATLAQAAQSTEIPGLDIVPATQDLSGAEVELVSVEDRTHRLQKALAAPQTGFAGYDIAFIDCPPSLGLLTLNALGAADTLLVPLQCEFFALEGLSQLLQTVERIQQRFNPDLGIVGIALTMFDRRNRLTDQVADDVRDCLGNLVFENVIPRNVRLSEAPSHGMPALIYDHNCPGSRAYIGLARELIGRLPEKRKAA
jgi:chromosome partitioning protein